MTLADIWRSKGIAEGAAVLLHSSAKRTLRENGVTPTELIQSFLDAIGPSGTLLLPVYNFGFFRGEPFDIRMTPGETGILGNTAMQWPGAVRTCHPVYSAMAIGARAHEFRDRVLPCTYDTGDGLGRSSIFGWLHYVKGTIAILDLPDQNSQTYLHFCEQHSQAKWRFHKFFSGQYTDENGQTALRTVSIFVRKEGIQTNVEPTGRLLWDAGLYRGDKPHVGSGLRTIGAAPMFDFVTTLISAIQQGAASHKLLYLQHDVQLPGYPALAAQDMASMGD